MKRKINYVFDKSPFLSKEALKSVGYAIEKLDALEPLRGADCGITTIYVDSEGNVKDYRTTDFKGVSKTGERLLSPAEVDALPAPEGSVQARIREVYDYLTRKRPLRTGVPTDPLEETGHQYRRDFEALHDKFRELFAPELGHEKEEGD